VPDELTRILSTFVDIGRKYRPSPRVAWPSGRRPDGWL